MNFAKILKAPFLWNTTEIINIFRANTALTTFNTAAGNPRQESVIELSYC